MRKPSYRFWPLLLALLLLPPSALAQTTAGFMLSKQNFCDTIPIDYRDGLILLRVNIGGRDFLMNLDTGRAQGVAFNSELSRTGRNVGNVVMTGDEGERDTIAVTQLPEMRLGSLAISGYVMKEGRQRPAPYCDGTLGFDLIGQGLKAKIDVRRRQLILTDRPGQLRHEEGYEAKYKLRYWLPYVYVSPFMRHTDMAVFDTGSRDLFTMSYTSFEEHAYKSKQVNAQVEERAKGSFDADGDGVAETLRMAFLNLDRLKWDDFSFLKVHAITTEKASRIGSAILDYGTVTIDPFRSRIKFMPYTKGESVVVDNEPKDAAYVSIRGKAVVGFIRKKSNAYKAGLRQGDRIEAINGRRTASFQDFLRYPFQQGKTYVFTVTSKKGEQKKVSVKR